MSVVAITEDDVHRHYWAVALTSALSARQPHILVASSSYPTDHHTNALAGPSSLPRPAYDDVGKRHKTPRTPDEQERRRRKKEEKVRRKTLQAELDRALPATSPTIDVAVTDSQTDKQQKKKRKKEKVEQRKRQEEEEEDLADEAEIDELLPSSPVIAPLPRSLSTKRYKRNSSTFDRPDPEASSHPRPITTPRLPPIPIALPKHLFAEVGTATPASGAKKTKKASSWPTWATSTPEFLKKRKRQEA